MQQTASKFTQDSVGCLNQMISKKAHACPVESIAAEIAKITPKEERIFVAVAGPPASGKSTFAAKLVEQNEDFALVPMDGFHLDNSILDQRGLRQRKGAKNTFDVAGLINLMHRLRAEQEIFFPIFNRQKDLAIAGAGKICAEKRVVVVEGNYLLLNEKPWQQLHSFWDYSIFLSVDQEELKKRLINRWLSNGLTKEQAYYRAEMNDLINAEVVSTKSKSANRHLSSDGTFR